MRAMCSSAAADRWFVGFESLEPRLLLSAAISDEFSSFNNSLWDFRDPVGDSSIVVSGGQLKIGVPAGSSHDVWSTGFDAPRIMQDIDDTDFTLEVKFNNPPTGRYALNGIVVAANDRDFVRFDFYSSSTTSVKLFAAGFGNLSPSVKINTSISGGSPMYMRVERAGDQWTQSYSYNGSTWTTGATFNWALDVNKAGVFVGNAAGSSSPAFTGAIDYFRNVSSGDNDDPPDNDTEAPQIRNIDSSGGDTYLDVSFTTNETAAATVYYGRTTSYELGSVGGPSATSHSIRLTGLTPDTTYRYKIVATDAAGNSSEAAGLTGRTAPAGSDDGDTGGGGAGSDEFSSPSLDTGLWTFVNPRGDASVSVSNGQLRIAVPGGTDHDVWKSGNFAPRVMQSMSNGDFEIEVKFNSRPSGQYALNGVLVDAGGGNYLRFDFYSSSSTSVKVFAAAFTNNSPSVKLNRSVSSAAPVYMRIARAGDRWTQSYSYDGQSWTTGAVFTHSLAVSTVGVFAGNAGTNPAYTASIDYVRLDGDSSEPGGDDVTAPQIVSIATSPGDTYVDVNYATNEPTTSFVRYGLTTSYEFGVVAAVGTSTSHHVRLAGLPGGSRVHYQIVVADAAGNVTTSSDRTVTLADAPQGGTDIDLWYGSNQSFGNGGAPQRQVNVLGNAHDPDGIASLSFTLNGGQQRSLSIGPDNRRLENTGDFNIEIDRSQLVNGTNTIVIRAVDRLGNLTLTTVTVSYTSSKTAPMPLTIDWSSFSSIQQAAQVVDGDWRIQNGAVRTTEVGYDRLIALGEMNWTDYEITVPITIHSIDSSGFDSPSNGPAIGIVARWQGHYDWNGSQPSYGYAPLGAIGWYRWDSINAAPTLQIYGSWSKLGTNYDTHLKLGVKYMWKMRVETVSSGHQYSLKVWRKGSGEPADWSVVAITGTGLDSGSAMLLAHHVDATFGDVKVTPI